jgi:DNA (cytosine-5)-methyltransferase 1
MSKQTFTVGSLFSGVGGIDLGLERAGLTVKWQVEQDKYCQSVLKHRFPGAEVYNDITETESETLGAVDLICGGFPCQDVSVAGERKGLDGGRSGLWFEFHRIVSDLQPQWVLVENVPGLLQSNGGRDFATILRGLGGIGYGVSWRVLDSQFFGVPQRRRRVYIVACRGTGGAERAYRVLHPQRESGARDSEESREEEFHTAAEVSEYIDEACYWDGGQISDTLDVSMLTKGQMLPEKRRCPVVIVRGVARRLTPLEAERLQGFPDNWTYVEYKPGQMMSNTQRFKQLGNAVTVTVAEWIGDRIAFVEGKPASVCTGR